MKTRDVILFTDLGTDIDDSWALALLLKSPELKLHLVVTTTGDTYYRAKVAKRLLKAAGRSDIPVAVGKNQPEQCPCTLAEYLNLEKDDTDVSTCPPAEPALLAALKECSGTPAIIAIGPLGDLGRIVKAHPEIAAKCDLIGMLGSVYKGYSMQPPRCGEYNITKEIPEAKQVLDQTRWHSVTITPLDTCGNILLTQEQFAALKEVDPLMHEVIASNEMWQWRQEALQKTGKLPEKTSCLFDTVAVYLAVSEKLCKIESLGLCVDDKGVYQECASPLQTWRCAVEWTNYDLYIAWLLKRLATP